MVDKAISALNPAGALLSTDLVEVVRGNQNLKATAGGFAGVSIGKSMVSAYTPTITDPTTLSWRLQRMLRPNQPFSPRLQTFLDECTQDNGYYTRSGNVGTFSYANGLLTLASTADTAGNGINIFGYETFEYPAFSVSLEGITATTDTNFNAIGLGIAKGYATANLLYAYFEIGSTSQKRVTIAKIVGGAFTIIAQTALNSLPTGMSGIAVQFVGNGYTVWIQVSGRSWVPVLTAAITDFNLLSGAELQQWHPYYTVTGGVSVPWTLSAIRSGYSSGPSAFRDFKIVTNKDGTPYVSNGYLYFTTSRGTQAVWRMSPKNGDFEEVGVLGFTVGGVAELDLNANIVWDADIAAFRVVFARWSQGLSPNVKLYSLIYRGDLLNGVHTGLAGTLMTVTQQSGNSIYDECLVWDGANSRWLLSYAVSPGGSFGGNMYIALDQSTDLVTWTGVWAATAVTGYEGSAIAKFGGNWFVFAGNGTNFRVWNVAGTNLGTLTVDVFPPTSGNPPPHFVPFPWMDGDTTQYYALSWNNSQWAVNGAAQGTFATGAPMLYRATATEAGFELPLIGAL